MLLGLRVGTGQQVHVIGMKGVAGKHLGTVQNIFVAVTLRLQFQRTKIRPDVRFAEALAILHFALSDGGQVAVLLILCTEYHDGRPNNTQADGPTLGNTPVAQIFI